MPSARAPKTSLSRALLLELHTVEPSQLYMPPNYHYSTSTFSLHVSFSFITFPVLWCLCHTSSSVCVIYPMYDTPFMYPPIYITKSPRDISSLVVLCVAGKPQSSEQLYTTHIDKPVKLRAVGGSPDAVVEPITVHEMFARTVQQAPNATALGLLKPSLTAAFRALALALALLLLHLHIHLQHLLLPHTTCITPAALALALLLQLLHLHYSCTYTYTLHLHHSTCT